MKKIVDAEEESTTRTTEVEEKPGTAGDGSLAGAAPDDLTALKLRLALTDTIDYKLPPVIGD